MKIMDNKVTRCVRSLGNTSSFSLFAGCFSAKCRGTYPPMSLGITCLHSFVGFSLYAEPDFYSRMDSPMLLGRRKSLFCRISLTTLLLSYETKNLSRYVIKLPVKRAGRGPCAYVRHQKERCAYSVHVQFEAVFCKGPPSLLFSLRDCLVLYDNT